ncbi:MAG TPA: imelysin family protein [Nannocystaceae bacterium]|nr:imelysin family protein [Nannocystaceae bacterium]
MPVPATHTLRAWFVPLALAGLGAVGWACRDGASSTGSDDGSEGDDEAAEGSEVGEVAEGDASADDPDSEGASDPSGPSEVTRRDVLASIGTHVIVPATAEFEARAMTLQSAVQSWADAVAQGGASETQLAAARAAWHEAMIHWQQLEVMQVGPAAPSLVAIAGEDLRDAIYSWPTADTCSVDRALVDEDYAAADFFETELVWVYGLDALEYLLFVQPELHTCPAQVQLDAPWAALGAEERARRRGAYASVVAGGVRARAEALAHRWAANGGDFTALLADPGSGDSPYADEVEALDQVFRAMFYVELQSKDAKLGVPIGIVAGCPTVPCIDLLELPHSGAGAAAIRANLEALRVMVRGGPDPASAAGFDDLLAQLGEQDIADDLDARIGDAIAACDAYESSLQSALATDPEALHPLYDAVKGVTDVLKGPFVMALMLTVPAEGAGDND